jgi:hypothetical protein
VGIGEFAGKRDAFNELLMRILLVEGVDAV